MEVPIFQIPLQIFKKSEPADTPSSCLFEYAFYKQSKPMPAFSVTATYTPLLRTGNSESCSFLTIPLVTSMVWSAI